MTLYRWEHDSLPFLPNFCFLRPWTGYLSWHSALKSLSNPTSYIATGTTEKHQHCQADSLGSFIKSVANLDIDPACPLVQRGFSPDGQWVSMLSNHLSGKCDVINRGFSGYNTRMVKHFIEKAPGMPSFRIVIIEKLHRFVIPILGATDEIVNSFYFRWRLQQLLAGMFIALPLKNHIVWSYDEHTWKQCSWYLLTWQRETLSLSCSWEPTTVLSRTKDSTSPLMSTSQTWVTFSGMVTNFAFALFPFNVSNYYYNWRSLKYRIRHPLVVARYRPIR